MTVQPSQEDGLRVSLLAGPGATIVRHRVTRLCLVALLLLVALLPGSSEATTWSAVDDFSTTTKTDTSTWSYREQAGNRVRGGNFSLLSSFGNAGNPWPDQAYWNDGSGYVYPAIGVNQTRQTLRIGGSWGGPEVFWQPNTMWINPANNGPVVLSWLSPHGYGCEY